MKHLLGHHQPQWEPLAHAFDALFERGDDLGASLALTVEGELVLDHWGGWCDEARRKPWDRNTLTHVWSTTKTMTSLCALLLADRGELDLDAPVAAYWPEFAANGKSGILVRDVLGHTSGVSGWEQPMGMGDLCDCERSTALLAGQSPWWTPGSASGYHALNYGHLVGELIRRVTGQKTSEFLKRELAGPLGADFHIGLPPEHDGRVARVVPPPPAPVDFSAIPPDSPMLRTLGNPAPDAAYSHREDWCRADIGAANGHGNARSVAQLQSIVACEGTLAGRRWLKPQTVDRIFEVQARGIDLVLGVPLCMGMGYGLPEPATLPFIPEQRICFWGGWGGSLVLVDVERRLCLAYMMNRMAPGVVGGPNAAVLVQALYACCA
ncbi:serine hydrolase domain-containing protein [Roseateles sp. NT4]|uniref:serine hydrolase domain-containing protein n=1 Tax=Roseateles sp. NT4 TaxID=3453715 RepID=UPI003EF02BBA